MNPKSCEDVINEALDLIEDRIDELRLSKGYREGSLSQFVHMKTLKTVRDILKLGGNFSDE